MQVIECEKIPCCNAINPTDNTWGTVNTNFYPQITGQPMTDFLVIKDKSMPDWCIPSKFKLNELLE